MMAFTQERACVLPVPSQRTEEGSSTGEQGAPCGPSPVILQPCGAHASVHLPSCGRGLCWALATGCHPPCFPSAPVIPAQRRAGTQHCLPQGPLRVASESGDTGPLLRHVDCGAESSAGSLLESADLTAWTGSMGGVAGLSVCSTVGVKCTGGLGPLP